MYKPKNKDAELIKKVEAMFDIAEKAKKPLHKIWRECEKLYNDNHWKLEGMPKNKNEVTVNLIASAIDTMVPILSSRPPKIDVLPASTEPEDAQIANIMQAQLDDLWEMRDMQGVVPEFLLDFLVYGNGVMKMHFGEDDLPDADVVDPFNFYVNPMASRLEDAQWVIYAAPVPVSEIKRKYKNGKHVKPQANLSDYEAMKMYEDFQGQTVIPTDTGNHKYETDARAAESLEERALLIECWYKPEAYGEDDDYGPLRLTTIANGVLLYDGPSPYPFLTNEYNVIHPFPFIAAKNGGSAHTFWGRPEPKRLKTINLSMDKVFSQVMDNISLMANPQWIIDESAGVSGVTNQPGGVIRKSGSGQVDMSQPKPMPHYVFNYLQMMESMFEVVSGVNRATQGREAPNVTSGVQAEAYRRAATTKIDFKARSIDMMIQQLGAVWLAMIQNLGEEEHMVTIAEELGDVEYGYTGVMIADKQMRVRSKPGSMMPDNKQYIEEKVLALAQLGIITDPEFIIDNVELPNKQVLLNKIRDDKAVQQQAENEVASEEMDVQTQLQNATDEDEILSLLEQNPELSEQYI